MEIIIELKKGHTHMPPPPRHSKVNDKHRVALPRNVKDVPRYLKELISTINGRMFYIIKLVWEASPHILFVLSIMTIFKGVIPVIGSLIAKEILNYLSKAYIGEVTTFDVIATLLLLQCAFNLFRDVVERVYQTITRISGEVISNHIKLKIMKKSREVDLSNYDSPEYYSRLENATREAANKPMEALNAVFSIISTLISIVSYIIVIMAIGIMPALLIIAVAIPSTIINFILRKKNFMYLFARSKERRKMEYFSQIVVNKDLVKEIKMMNLLDMFTEKYRNVQQLYFKGVRKLIVQECVWNIGIIIVSAIVNCVLFVYIARGVFEGQYEVGYYALYTGALTSVSTGISNLITTTASIYESTLFINNLIVFMKEEPRIVPSISPARTVKKGVAHTIVFENVSFRYPEAKKYVLQNINLTIAAQQSLVIVGLNGAGKTTLLKLLMRLYDPTEGRILLDNYDIREYNVEDLYHLFGTVFQDYGKYADTIKENVAIGNVMRELTQEAIEEATKNSNSYEYIQALERKFETPLTRYFEEDGTELSIGQWQKLAIARAFYGESDILILDEPTAALDPMAEQEIFNQFDKLRTNKTSIFVSHRLSSATTADLIVVMKHGEIIELGNHIELMDMKKEYYTLFTTQAGRYQSDYESKA